MAERVIRQIIDDIDKSEIAEGEGERIEFTFRGVAYQLDLSNANVAKLEKALAALRLWSGNQHEVWVAVTRCLRVQWKRIRRVELSRFLNPHPTRLTCFTSLL